MKKELKKAGAVIAAGVMLLSQTQMFSIGAKADETAEPITCLLYTSDAADE